MAAGTEATRAAISATTTTPIVMLSVADPVGSGFAKTLRRPGGNVTGLASLFVDVTPKGMEIFVRLLGKPYRLAALFNPADASSVKVLSTLEGTAKKLGGEIVPLRAASAPEIDEMLSTLPRQIAKGLVVAGGTLFNQQARQIADWAVKHRLPSIGNSYFVSAGGLMSYSPDGLDFFRRAAAYVIKIFKGATPGELPIEQPIKFDLVINQKTAKAIGVIIPGELLLRADKVIE